MKNEDKIVELLTEVVRKQDQHEEILLKHTELLGKITDRLDNQGHAIGQVVDRLDNQGETLGQVAQMLEGTRLFYKD